MPFDSTIDSDSRVILDDDGKRYCNRFRPVIRIGETVEVGKITAETLYPLLRNQEEIVVTLLASTKPDPRYPDDQYVMKLGNLSVDISESGGRKMTDREIKLQLRFGETEIRADASNPRTGMKYRTKVDFDYY